MLDIIAQIDILGLGALIGSLLFLAGLVWVLLDDRSFEALNRRHAGREGAGRASTGEVTPLAAPAADSPDTDDGRPGGPSRPRRAA